MTRREVETLIAKYYKQNRSRVETVQKLINRGVNKEDAILMVNDYFESEDE